MNGWDSCNGCTNVLTDPKNCGSCNKTCKGTCTNGTCDLVFAKITNVPLNRIVPSWNGEWTVTTTMQMTLSPINLTQKGNSVDGVWAHGAFTSSGTVSDNGYILTGTVDSHIPFPLSNSQAKFEFDMTEYNHFKGWLGATKLEVENNKSKNPAGDLQSSR